jgi:hypothetical protein
MYSRAARLLFGLTIAPPCPTTPAPVQCAAGNPLGPNNLPVSWSEGTLSSQLNVRHVFNMTRGPTMAGLYSTQTETTSTPEPCLVAQYLFRPVSNYPSTLGYF